MVSKSRGPTLMISLRYLKKSPIMIFYVRYLKKSPIPNTPFVEEYTSSILGALLVCFFAVSEQEPRSP